MIYKLSRKLSDDKMLEAREVKTNALAFEVRANLVDPFIVAHLSSYDYIEVEFHLT